MKFKKSGNKTGLRFRNGKPIIEGDWVSEVLDTENGKLHYRRRIVWVKEWAGFGLLYHVANHIERIGSDPNHLYFERSK